MARFSKMETLFQMERIGLVPVFYNPDFNVCKNIIDACYQGGAKCIEFTNRGDGAFEVFKQLEQFAKVNLPGAILGAGSICDSYTASIYINCGANFIVGPVFDKETVVICNKRKIPYSPGCGTISEIHTAHSYGVDICKIFPGDTIGGPAFVKAIKGPCPWVSVMPTGGVNPNKDSLKEWFKAGIVCVGIGSKLITEEIIHTENYQLLKENIKKTINLINDIRSNEL